TQIGSGKVSAGVATLASSALAVGAHSIAAQYSGDANFASVTSTALAQAVIQFSIGTASGGSATGSGVPGGFVTYQLTVTPPSNNSVTFTVTGLPKGFTATFTPNTVPTGAGPTNVTLTIHIPSQVSSAAQVPARPGSSSHLPYALGLLLLPLLGIGRSGRRLSRSLLLALLAVAGLAATLGLSGCSHNFSSFNNANNNPPPPGSYALTVTAAAGSQTQSTTLTLNVQ
ncbi:MAG TPA: Ig-like domain repeat protein, partial [Terracidiphilus sp.]|nr:Ig-like domain repeat protein [Terracidiphilus sp.]